MLKVKKATFKEVKDGFIDITVQSELNGKPFDFILSCEVEGRDMEYMTIDGEHIIENQEFDDAISDPDDFWDDKLNNALLEGHASMK